MSAPPVKKACDACHRRKVRCTGGQPCKNCGQASLQCTYLAVPQKKGPKGSRAKVISEIRDTQQTQQTRPTQHIQQASPSQQPHHTQQMQHRPQMQRTPSSHETEQNPFDFNTSPISPYNHTRDADLLSKQTVDGCIDFFFSDLYPTMPIFSRQRLGLLADNYRNAPPEIYCLVLSICAFVIVQPGMNFEGAPPPSPDEEDPYAARCRLATRLLREIHQIRKTVDCIEAPTLYSVQISFFVFSSYFGLDKTNQGWYHLREASTLAHILNMNEESEYRKGDMMDNMYKRRFYWLLLITERAYAMERHKPLSMLATIELPSPMEAPHEAAVISGFLYLASLFRLVDDEYMAFWNKARSECSTAYLSELQSQLLNALPPTLECTENQVADVRITQHWLRTMVWQLSITNGMLSSNSRDAAMTLSYPIQIAKDLIRDINQLSLASMEVHGPGLIEKLFDMSCTLSDVIAFVPAEASSIGHTQVPHDFLNQLLNLISSLRGGASRYVPLLMAKVQDHIPNSPKPLAHMPLTLDAFVGEGSSGTSGTPASTSRSVLSVTTPQPVTTPQTPYGTIGRPSPFMDSSQSSHGLVFDAYSPSTASQGDMAMTPPLSRMHGATQAFQQNVPRSTPATVRSNEGPYNT